MSKLILKDETEIKALHNCLNYTTMHELERDGVSIDYIRRVYYIYNLTSFPKSYIELDDFDSRVAMLSHSKKFMQKYEEDNE